MKSVKARFEQFDAEVDAEEAPAAAPTPARPEKRKRSEVEALGLAPQPGGTRAAEPGRVYARLSAKAAAKYPTRLLV